MFKCKQEITDAIVQHLKDNGLYNENKDYQLYTINHKQAMIAVMLSLYGRVTKSAILHDNDKLYTHGITTIEEAKVLHRSYSRHHRNNTQTELDVVERVIDYECARFTKEKLQKNACLTVKTLFPDDYEQLEPTLSELGLLSTTSIDIDFTRWEQLKPESVQKIIDLNIQALKKLASDGCSSGSSYAVNRFYSYDFSQDFVDIE